MQTTLFFAQPALNAPVGNQVEKWRESTSGINLAAGKSVWFSLEPNYRRFSKDGYDKKLTDGVLGEQENGQIWFSERTVGWHSGADEGIDMLIDLGGNQPVDRVVARFVGGKKAASQGYPAEISVLLSVDGETFFQASQKRKVTDGEAELAQTNPETYFYLVESGTSFVEPITLAVKSHARYVVLRVRGESSWIWLDELAIMKNEQAAALAGVEQFPKAIFVHQGVSIRPRTESLVITTNVPTPNTFTYRDFRNLGPEQPFDLVMDLPAGAYLIRQPEGTQKLDTPADGRVRYRIKTPGSRYRLAGPYYFGVEPGFVLEEGAKAHFSWLDGETLGNTVTLPVQTVQIPEVSAAAQGLDVSLAWMRGDEIKNWPDFLKVYRHLGFSIVPIFPSNDSESAAETVKQAREAGMRVVLNEFNRMEKQFGKEQEIFNQVRGKAGKHICPAYTGPFYRQEVERVATAARDFSPDFVFYDIELWQKGAAESRQCERCREAFKQSGETEWDAFTIRQGTRMMKDLRKATNGAAPGGDDPRVGLYNVKAVPSVYHGIYDFQQLYPEAIDLAQPSLYVGGDAAVVGETIRANYAVLQKRNIIPWLTAGTYGQYPPHRLEQMILESYLNGAGGITYYAFRDFDPMTFYYHASALAKLAPYAELLKGGRLVPAESSVATFRCSAFGNEREALLLVGNYRSAKAAKGEIRIAGKIASCTEVDVVGNGKAIDLREVEVPAGGHSLLHIVFE